MALPYSEISMLLNERATHARIVQSILSMETNDRIAFNDPIIIFFSGCSLHNDSGTVFIVPYDYPDSQAIAASVIDDLLTRVAAAKGENIVRLSLLTFRCSSLTSSHFCRP